jgi:hypothetical protein
MLRLIERQFIFIADGDVFKDYAARHLLLDRTVCMAKQAGSGIPCR